ncbi:hypothetical protein [Arthrobacter oryzae]|jgi:hypothetical protein|nr:hypothetical protein [Arthrobacter oryzae]MDQ0075514.1 hypothetical protein [Arthrobacter oryzae]
MHSSPVPACPETDVVVVGEAIIDIRPTRVELIRSLELAQTSRKNSDD